MNTILIVEGDACQRASLAAALSEEYLVATVCHVREAISFLEEHNAEVVVFDMAEANGEGVAMLSRMAGLRPRPQIVVLTSQNQPSAAVKAIKLGANEYLVKPCGVDALRTALKHTLDDRPEDAVTRGHTGRQ